MFRSSEVDREGTLCSLRCRNFRWYRIAEILNLGSLFEPREGDRLRVTIRPLTPDLRYWATISVTHNATQHVTVLSPE